MREGWLIDRDDYWIWRFHREEKAWVRDPKVFIDRGRQMPDGPPLLRFACAELVMNVEELGCHEAVSFGHILG